MAAGFFRKAALEKLSTPEKLDQLIKITSKKAWIALSTIALILVTAIGWSFIGKVKTKLTVTGVLLGGEIHEVVSTSKGQLTQINAFIGQKINKGDVIAIVEQPELLQQIEEVEALLVEEKKMLTEFLSFGNKDSKLQSQYILQQQLSLKMQIGSSYNQLKFLKNQLQTENDLLKNGLITKSQVVNTRQQIENVSNSIESLKAQKVQTSSQKLNIGFDNEQRINNQEQRIAETKRRYENLKELYKIQTNIKSPFDGQVVELLCDRGIIVGQGTPLFKLKNYKLTTDDKLRGVLYIPSQDGKKIKVGMEALVVPSTVQPQEYGFIKGKVTYVSDFPITQKGMMTSVKNDQLVQGLLSMGAPFEVFVEFEKDNNSYSGFKWTSVKGPEIAIHEGTSCMGKITVKTEPPVAIVVPALKKFFDLY